MQRFSLHSFTTLAAVGLIASTGFAGSPDSGELALQTTDCSADAFPGEMGFQVEIELEALNLTGEATGYQAFLAYDTSQLAFREDLSSYDDSIFDTHITPMMLAEMADGNPGTLQLDGNTFMDPGTSMDTPLATLVFDVNSQCTSAVPVSFTTSMGFESELSNDGDPLDTTTTDAPATTFDNTPPMITCPSDVTASCESDADPDNSGMATATDNCTAEPMVTFSDTDNGGSGCPMDALVITRTWTATDDCGNTATCEQMITLEDNEAPMITCPDDVELNADAGGCDAILDGIETFDSTVPLCEDQTPDCWYVDRFAPATFASAMFDGDNRLCHGVVEADGEGNRPSGFKSPFYNTQGRKYDINFPVGSTLAADIYIDSDWMTETRRAGMWATTFNSSGAISGFPIVGAVANDPNSPGMPRFRIFTQDINQDTNDGLDPGFVDLGPIPTFGAWYRFETELTSSSYEFRVLDDTNTVIYSFSDAITFGSIRIGNVILQVYNFTEDYTVYWDNVTLGPQGPVATDNCDDFLDVTVSRSDGMNLDDPFPAGDTTVTYTATDDCGNSASCDQIVTVNAVNEVNVIVELPGSIPTTRCIHFLADGTAAADVGLTFTDHDSDAMTPVRATATVEVPCGDYSYLCAKDEQHTLWDTTTLSISGTQYDADMVLTLDPGDNDNDGDVDINDVTFLIATFGDMAADGGCPYDGTRDADYDNDNAIQSADYSLLSPNFLTVSGCNDPSPLMAGRLDGRASVLTTELDPWIAQRADLDRNGVVDWRDVKRFEQANGLANTLSDSLRTARANTRR